MKIVSITAAAAALIIMLTLAPFAVSADSEAYFTLTEVEAEEDGSITVDGKKWFKAKNFDDDKNYVITVKNGSGEELAMTVADGAKNRRVWQYYRRTMVASSAPRFTLLSSGGRCLVFTDGKLSPAYRDPAGKDLVWERVGSALRCIEGEKVSYLRYDEESDEPLSVTEELSEAAEVNVYTNGDQLERCIVSQPSAESYVIEGSGYPAPSFTVGLADVSVDRIDWFVDKEPQSGGGLTFTAETLANRPAGVHRVHCIVEARDSEGVRYRERSEDALFVVAKGVVPDSVLTFSDIHEEYTRIGDAIGCVIERTGGYIPALAICTGDFVNGPKADPGAMLGRYYPRVVAELGGLDAVFVSGNHDSGEAASAMSAAAGLGAEGNTPSGGLIFDGGSVEVAENGRNSRFAKGIIAYGLNQEAVMETKDGSTTHSYEKAIGEIEAFLKETAADYRGELVIISAHTGLHALGVQPESVNAYGYRLSEWIGENQYNIDESYELAALINDYAERYGMDIMYLFGHDHSRSETEMIMTDGDELVGAKSYADLTAGSQTLRFTYAHSGYLSTAIGCADSSFSFIYRNGGGYAYELIRTYDGRVRDSDIATRYVPAETAPETTSAAAAETAAAATAAATTAAVPSFKTGSPKTGDDTKAALIALPAAVLLLSRRRNKRRET